MVRRTSAPGWPVGDCTPAGVGEDRAAGEAVTLFVGAGVMVGGGGSVGAGSGVVVVVVAVL